MRRLTALFIIGALFAVQAFPQAVKGQQKTDPTPIHKTQNPPLSFFVEGNYFGPKLSDVNAVYGAIEKNYSLPAGQDFKATYNVLAGLRYDLTSAEAVQGEFGVSVLKSHYDSSANYHQLYSAGGSYLLKMSTDMLSIYGGAGLSYVWLNTERTYTTTLGIARVNGQMVQFHGVLGVEFLNPTGVSFGLEGRYLYATTISPRRPDLDFTLKGITAGIRLGVPIVL